MVQAKQMLQVSDVDAVMAESARRPVLVFKHSTTCPISANAHKEWQRFLELPEAANLSHYWVRVIEERPVSLALAERVGVTHQSPQALLIKDGKAVWHDSHWQITVDALKAAVAGAGA